MDRVRQFFISDSVKFFRPVYEVQYDLTCVNETGYDPLAPCLFFGMYRQEDMDRINRHQGKRLIAWCGVDAANLATVKAIAENAPDAVHISMSHRISAHLRQFSCNFRQVALPNTLLDYCKPEPKGPRIYCYAPNEGYGRALAQEVADKLPEYDLILTDSCTQYSLTDLYELYKKSFVGLRFKVFDGSGASVSDMALMGRYTVSNNGTPSCLPYAGLDDILAHIREQAKTIGTVDTVLASFMRQYLDVGTSWLQI
jgi:hypothetical protein